MAAQKYKCRIYVRVSTKEQADPTKSSLQDQLKRCRQVIKQNGWEEEVGEIFRDTDTGQTVEREGINKALKEGDAGTYNVLVIYDYDRLSRHPGDCINLVTRDFLYKGIQVFSFSQRTVLDPPDKINFYSDTRLIPLIMSAFKVSADINRMRAKYDEGMLNKINRGQIAHPAMPPYGYHARISEKRRIQHNRGFRIEWEVFIYEPEAAVVRRIFDDYLRGKSYRQIARDLTDEQIPTPKGAKWWSYSTIKLILENPVYEGKTRWQWKKTPIPKKGQKRQPKDKWIVRDGKHAAIVDSNRFAAVQRLMTIKEKLPGRFSQGKALLAGRMTCAHCQKRMWSTAATKTAQAYYVCSTWHQFRKCVANFVAAKEADEAVLDKILALVKNEKRFIKLYDEKLSKTPKEADPLVLQREILEGLLAERERLIVAVQKEVFSLDDVRNAMQKLDSEIKPVQKNIEELERKENEKKTASEILHSIKGMGDIKVHLNENKPQLRTYLLDLLESVEATKTGRGEHKLKVNFRAF